MKIIDVIPKDICINMEFTSKEICEILDFLEKAMPLYAKVHLNGSISESLRSIDVFIDQLKSISKMIKEGSKI